MTVDDILSQLRQVVGTLKERLFAVERHCSRQESNSVEVGETLSAYPQLTYKEWREFLGIVNDQGRISPEDISQQIAGTSPQQIEFFGLHYFEEFDKLLVKKMEIAHQVYLKLFSMINFSTTSMDMMSFAIVNCENFFPEKLIAEVNQAFKAVDYEFESEDYCLDNIEQYNGQCREYLRYTLDVLGHLAIRSIIFIGIMFAELQSEIENYYRVIARSTGLNPDITCGIAFSVMCLSI